MCSVDINGKENYKNIKEVPLNAYDTVFICTPDTKKIDLIIQKIKKMF